MNDTELVWGNGAPIPGFPRPRPEFSGTGWGQGQALQKFRGIFGDGDGLNFGVFWGFIPENPQKIIGDTLGMGIGSSLGIYWGFPWKKTQFLGIPQKSPFWWIMSIVTCIKVLHKVTGDTKVTGGQGRGCNPFNTHCWRRGIHKIHSCWFFLHILSALKWFLCSLGTGET